MSETARAQGLARGLSAFGRLPEVKRDRATARRWIIDAIKRYEDAHNLTHTAALLAFCADFARGEIEAPPHVLALRRGSGPFGGAQDRQALTPPTVRRWEAAYARQGLIGLTDGYGNRQGLSKIERCPQLRDIILGCILKTPHITPKKIKQYLAAEERVTSKTRDLPRGLSGGLPVVSAASIGRFIARWQAEHAQSYRYATDPDGWKNHYQASAGSQHETVIRLNQVWELDSTPGDWELLDPDTKTGRARYMVLGAVDLYSRRLKFLVAKTSKAETVCSLFRRALLDWGVPEGVRTDNGKDYVSEHFTTVLAELEIAHLLCAPFASEQKGTIERHLQTMSHGILDLLPGFIGHNVAQRKVIEARKSFARRMMTPGATIEVGLTAAELQTRLDQWSDKLYAHDTHSGQGIKGLTPFEKAAAWTQPIRRVEDERALDYLLVATAGIRKVTKKGLKLDHYEYLAPELSCHQARVHVKRDAGDLGRLYVYAAEDSEVYGAGEFICVAKNPELTGISRQEAALAMRRAQRALVALKSAEVRGYTRALKRDLVTAVMEDRVAQSDNVTAFRFKSTPHTTPHLEQKGIAARALEPPQFTPVSDEARAATAAAMAEEEAEALLAERLNDPRRNYAYWARLDRRARAGETLPSADHAFWRQYHISVQRTSMQDHFEEFGLSIDKF